MRLWLSLKWEGCEWDKASDSSKLKRSNIHDESAKPLHLHEAGNENHHIWKSSGCKQSDLKVESDMGGFTMETKSESHPCRNHINAGR